MSANAENERMIARYQERFREHGQTPQSLGWTKGKQDIRFDVLLSGFQLEGLSVLDVGCGFGDLNLAIRERCQSYRYLGVDLVPEFIEKGRATYGSESVGFMLGDLMEVEVPGEYDICIASGIFNSSRQDVEQYDYVKRVLGRLFEISRVGVAVDFLSDRVNFQREGCAHHSPEQIFSVAMGLTRCVRLRHDYMPFEFAVTLYKDDSYEDAETVFNHYKHERKDHRLHSP